MFKKTRKRSSRKCKEEHKERLKTPRFKKALIGLSLGFGSGAGSTKFGVFHLVCACTTSVIALEIKRTVVKTSMSIITIVTHNLEYQVWLPTEIESNSMSRHKVNI